MGVGSTWAQTVSKWDGTVAAKIATGAGTQANPYIINSAAELAYFGSQMNGKTWYVQLGVDIDLNNREWTYGKNSATNFKGHFDGNGKTISNLKIEPGSAKNNGFFSSLQGTATSRAEVKNLIIDSVTISQTADLAATTTSGALAGNVTEYTDIDSVTVKNVSIKFKNLTNANYLGALVGRVEKNKSIIKNCKVENPTINITGEIKGAASYIGGAIGQFAGSANLVSTIEKLLVTSPSVTINKVNIKDCFIGAVFGRINTYSTISNVTVSTKTDAVTLNYKNTDAPNMVLNLGIFAGGIYGVAAQETAVTSITVTGDAQMTIGNSNDVKAVKAGIIAYASTNVRIEDWTIENSNILVDGNLATASSFIGGFAGNIVSAANAPATIKNIHVTGNTNVTVTGNVAIASYIGGQFGYLAPANAANNTVVVDGFDVDDKKETTVSIGGNMGACANYVGGFIGYAQGRAAANNELVVKNAHAGKTSVTIKGKITGASNAFNYIGGFVGLANTGVTKFISCSVSPNVNIDGNNSDIAAQSAYIGGAFGDFAGAAGYIASIDGLTIGNPSMVLKKVSVANNCVGSVFGRIYTYTTVNDVEVTGTASLEYKNTDDPNVTLYLGTLAGYIQGVAMQETSVTKVNIAKSSITIGNGSSEIKNIRAGIVGNITTKVLLDDWTIGSTEIDVKGNLSVATSYLGGLVGYVTCAQNAPVSIKNITINNNFSNSKITLRGVTKDVSAYFGGVIGYITTSDGVSGEVVVDGITDNGSMTIDLQGFIGTLASDNKYKGTVYAGGFAGYFQGKSANSNLTSVSNVALGDVTITASKDINATSYIGGFAGSVGASSKVKDCSVSKSTINAEGAISFNASYVGGAIANFQGAVGYYSELDGMEVGTSVISVNKITVGNCYVGGVFGRINTYSHVNNVHVTTSAGLTYNNTDNPNVAFHLGTVAGYITGVAGMETSVNTVSMAKGDIVLGTDENSVVSNIRAGAVGTAATNVLLDGWNVNSTTVTVNGALGTTASYIAGFVGDFYGALGAISYIKNSTVDGADITVDKISVAKCYVGSAFGRINTYSNVDGVTVSNSKLTYNCKDNPNLELYLGTFASYIAGDANQDVPVTNVTLTNNTLNIGSSDSEYKNLRVGAVGYINTRVRLNGWKAAPTVSYYGITINMPGKFITTADYVGGIVGNAQTNCELNDIAVKTKITTGDVAIDTRVGGIIGYAKNTPVTNSKVVDSEIILKGNNTSNLYVGGAAGWLEPTTAPRAAVIQTSVSNTSIHTQGTPTYAKGNKALVVGGVVGYQGQSNSTTYADVHNCVADNVTIDLSGYIPETGKTSDENYNQQQNAMVVGGVIGRINTPKYLPEELYFSGSINAPFAAVGPVVGVFFTKIDAATYLYEDYSGVNALSGSTEWDKEQSWYYNEYKLGLSSAVRGYSNTNYTATPDANGFITIEDPIASFTKGNTIGAADKKSFTVLAYSATGDITPAWNTNSATYPACYMYYMQGVNRGKYVNEEIEELKENILAGVIGIRLTLVDANGDMAIAANRGFIAHTLTVTPSRDEIDSYQWFANDEEQTAYRTNEASIIPAITGSQIKVVAIKDGKKVGSCTYEMKPVFRVNDGSVAVGTKTNPYLIGGSNGAEELQLLSYLSTLPIAETWEKDYNSSEHYNVAYYELDDDVDLTGLTDFTPISFLRNTNYTQEYIFCGSLDGKGHRIRNLKETWYAGLINSAGANNAWGLFAAIGGKNVTKVGDAAPSATTVKNLILDGAVLTHKTDNTSFYYNSGTSGNSNNCYIGVLAGIVGSYTTADNIEIRNSVITDEDTSSEYNLATRGLYVGGAIGSVQTTFNIENNYIYEINLQHIAAEVDITLNKPKFNSTTTQAQVTAFYASGIIGRYCSAASGCNTFDDMQRIMPRYTFYSGSITAPKAWISPVLAAARYVSQYDNSKGANFSKIWQGNNNTVATQLRIENAQYYNFRINGTLITEFVPSNTCSWNARSIMAHADATDEWSTYNAAKFQGVNYGARFIDSDQTSLEYLNRGNADGYYWAWDDGFPHMVKDTYQGGYLYPAGTNGFATSVTNGSGSGYTYSWQISDDGINWTDIAGATGQKYTPNENDQQRLIVAIIVDGSNVYRTPAEILPIILFKKNPFIKVTGDDASGYNLSVDWNGAEPGSDYTISYQWYHKDKTTEYSGETNQSMTMTGADFNSENKLVYCKTSISEEGVLVKEYMLVSMTVVYVNGDGTRGGQDNALGSTERGYSPDKPVKTLEHANSLLLSGSVEQNIIVVMGALNSTVLPMQCKGHNPATLTGKWDDVDYEGRIYLPQPEPTKTAANTAGIDGDTSNDMQNFILADTKYENLVFCGADKDDAFIDLHGYDVTFGTGLRMESNGWKSFHKQGSGTGNLNNENIPALSIVLTSSNPAMPNEGDWYREKPQTVTFRSGHYARVLGGRYMSDFFNQPTNTSQSIMATPTHPAWVVINVEIEEGNDPKSSDGGTTYDYDINMICAGLTDGSMYGDCVINLRGGRIGYVVGANQGNSVANGTKAFTALDGKSGMWGQWPNSSFFGRTVINMEQGDGMKDLVVNNLYAGGLGRQATDKPMIVDMYVYGHTEINMNGGTVKGNVYGGGAGGVLGLSPWDVRKPYATTAANNLTNAIINGVQYGGMPEGSPLADVVLHNPDGNGGYTTEKLNLANSSTTLNISGGTINGSVYGGGDGYVGNMPVDKTMQGVGSVFGVSNINISGGTINGSVYGGSKGSEKYYNQVNQYGQIISHIAEMNGTVNMKITGNDTAWPTILGNIYGAGQGIVTNGAEEYLRIATTGNTDLGDQYKSDINILFDMPESHPFEGNIYGGGQMGLVDGTTNVVIKRGIVKGCVFGAGKGEDGHINKAKVAGDTNVLVDKDYGEAEATENVVSIIKNEDGNGGIYGGGEMAVVDGNTNINIYNGIVGVDVFGGGLGETTVVMNNVNVNIGKIGAERNADAAVITGDVYGGSALGKVNGTEVTEYKTVVTLNAGEINGSIYGGALGQKSGVNGATTDIAANVYGPVEVKIYGGNVFATDGTGANGSGGVFGCNNLNGEPKNTVNVDIYSTNSHNYNDTPDDYTDDKYAIFSVYGGGNKANYSVGTPNVTVHNCDNSIGYIYGGGNAADITNAENGSTNVTIWGGNIIGNVFGGGNGAGEGNPGANVAVNTNAAIHGGKIINVYGGSNTLGDIGGKTNVMVLAQAENPGEALCAMDITNVYGGGNIASGKSGTVDIQCTGDAGKIKNVFGGANMADLTGDITLNIRGGNIENAFGGNNQSGLINGNIEVNVDWSTGGDACGVNKLNNVYGGGNMAPYYAYGYNDDGMEKAPVDDEVYGPIVNIRNGIVSKNVYGGGLGAGAVITGTPIVNLIGGAVEGDTFGGGDAAPVVGNTMVTLTGTSVGKWAEGVWTSGGDIYGGGNVAKVDGIAGVTINSGKVHDVYGGGNAADVTNTSVLVTDGTIHNVFGGGHGNKETESAANVTNNANTTINGGTIEQVFAAGNQLGAIDGQAILTIEKPDDATAKMYITEAYGGGNQADGNAGTVIVGCTGGDGEGVKDVFGGAREADVTSDITLDIKGGNINRVFGGNNVSGNVTGAIQVNIDQEENSCGLNLNYVYGGGQDAAYTPTTQKAYPEVNIKNGTVKMDVFGGGLGETAVVTSNPQVNIIGGTVTGNVYGGGDAAAVKGDPTVSATNGSATNIYAGGKGATAKVTGNPSAIIDARPILYADVEEYNTAKSTTLDAEAFDALTDEQKTKTPASFTVQYVFGGGNEADTEGNTTVTVKGGTIEHDVYGGGALADVTGATAVTISGGQSGDVYGGGLGQLAAAAIGTEGQPGYVLAKVEVAAKVGNSSVRVEGEGIANNVFGCNNTLGAPTGTVNVEIAGGTINNNVYGGGNLAAATVNPVVTVSGGTVTHDVYGGGALANITGNTTVNLTGGAVGGAYGGALGSAEIAAKVFGNTYVHLDGSKVTESGIFGANNLNGTPTGHVKVHVTSTTPRDGFEYAVPAVYGGGNLSAYVPTNTEDFAEVLIENCDNSIDYVYGGGNAAPVPATQVTIYGADAINHAFAGGNGAGQSEDPDAPNYNPGADIGFKGYYSQGSREEYGTGTAQITVYGGTVNNVYGGSNTLGYIRTSTKVEIDDVPDDYEGNHCTLNVGTVHGGGNEAELFCPTEVILGCSDGADVIFGGANNADINGDVTMTLRSGTYGKVFGGNNQGGCVKGKITINIDETGCEPVMIGELYCCGSYAPYSVYGYNDDGTCKTSGTALYDDPEINLISFTRIGKVFGGGLGETATLYGNTHVNVNPITGIFAGNDVQPIYVLDENDVRKSTSEATSLPQGVTRINESTIHIANEVGSIGSIYGGGNAGAVYGNTNVLIGTKTTNKHVSGTDKTTEHDVAVTITGNIFGGGNEAIVSGDTNVTIGENKIP